MLSLFFRLSSTRGPIPEVSARSKGTMRISADLSPQSALTLSSPLTSFEDMIREAPFFRKA